ncbi:degenerin-like protein asic-1 [Mytilus edulis]|uniref:degenerin-like protein asic-1 n=1 Tax=Mytilus edulis TaxID=6550 RepID=UPI0039EE9AE1
MNNLKTVTRQRQGSCDRWKGVGSGRTPREWRSSGIVMQFRLQEHIKREVYQGGVAWAQPDSCIRQVRVPSQEHCGWMKERINDTPLNVTIQTSNYNVLYGGTVTLKCEVAGSSVPFVVQWLKQEGQRTINITSKNTSKYNHNYDNGSEISTASLTIFSTDHKDAGVYICTTRNINGNDTIQNVLLSLEVTGLPLDVDPILSANEEFRLRMSYVDYIPDYINYTERAIKNMSADFSDFVIHCNFEGRPCNESVFVPFFDNYYGQCYRFPTEKIITRRAGPLFALKMLINVNQSDYVPYVASDAGIRLVIHEHGSQPYLENSGISVATGFRTDISLIQKRIERISGSTACDPSNKFKNINACFEECIDRNVKKKCKCLLAFSLAETKQMYTCFKDKDFECIEDVREHVTGCKCRNPCSEKRHEMTITTTRWPANNYEGLLKQILQNKGLSVSHIK